MCAYVYSLVPRPSGYEASVYSNVILQTSFNTLHIVRTSCSVPGPTVLRRVASLLKQSTKRAGAPTGPGRLRWQGGQPFLTCSTKMSGNTRDSWLVCALDIHTQDSHILKVPPFINVMSIGWHYMYMCRVNTYHFPLPCHFPRV